jgi:N-acetylglucosamine-6-phosphate deacetylase
LTSVVTDNMRVAGVVGGPTTFERMGRKLTVEGGVPRLADGTIAGSTLTMDKALKNVMAFTGLSLRGVLPMLTSSPARAAGFGDRKGRVATGYDADVVILDDDLAVRLTLAAGRTVYSRDAD